MRSQKNDKTYFPYGDCFPRRVGPNILFVEDTWGIEEER